MKAAAIILSIIGVIVVGLGVVCFVFHSNMAEDVELFSNMLLLPDNISSQEVIDLLEEFGYEFDPISLLAYRLGALPLIVGAILLIAGIVLLVVSGRKARPASTGGEGYVRPGFMKCPGCGTQIPLGTSFCVECGKTFGEPEPRKSEPEKPEPEKVSVAPAAKPEQRQPENGFVQCLNCGHVNKAGDSFCTNCGTALRGENIVRISAEQETSAEESVAIEDTAVAEEPVVIEEPVVNEEPVVIEEPVEAEEVVETEVTVEEEAPVIVEEAVAEEAVVEESVAEKAPVTGTDGFRISSTLKTDDGSKSAAPGRKYLKKAGDL